YDNWQASGVSGQGARSFYYPAKSQKCADCHMPLVPSHDMGNINGFVHSHRFPGANTALPYANQDPKQLEVTEQFLKDKIVSVDIFALAPARPAAEGAELPGAQLSTAFAVGEEAETPAPRAAVEALPVTAPLNRSEPLVRRGDAVRVDVVVRTRKVGHFFPGGTVDAFDCWLELQATDEKGQVLFWSGRTENGGAGRVEKGAHFYRSLMVDAHGNPINKRNAWATRALVYVRLIPPGAADTVHYQLRVPETAGEQITLRARLNYRKFAWWNTQFSFAGVRNPGQPAPEVTPDYDDGGWVNIGRVQVQEGNLSAAREVLEKALALQPNLARAHFFYARVLKQEGSYDQAINHLREVLMQYPRDRVVRNELGRVLFLQRRYADAVKEFEYVLSIDPEDLQAHYNLMLCYNGLGQQGRAREHQTRYLRFKADEAAQAITGAY